VVLPLVEDLIAEATFEHKSTIQVAFDCPKIVFGYTQPEPVSIESLKSVVRE
jgi:hypothetical protein